MGGVDVGDRLGSAGKNDAARTECDDVRVGDVPRMNFAVDAAFADAPCNQLRVLRTEVEDQNAMGVNVRRIGWK